MGRSGYGLRRGTRNTTTSPLLCLSSMSSVPDVLLTWRLPEFLGLGVVLLVLLLLVETMSQYEQYVPLINNEGSNGYPVTLGSERCFATDLVVCVGQASGCCTELDAGTLPSQTVPNLALGLISAGLPLAFILLRQGLRKWSVFRGVGRLQDVLLGLVFTLGMCAILTDFIKRTVGRPRPNYAALRALVAHGGSGYSSLKGECSRSFPSGHASVSTAGTAFITFVCWADLARCNCLGSKSWRRTVSTSLVFLPVVLGVWVGVTRVRNYWHFQDDVLAGWIIGALSAAVAIRFVVLPQRPIKPILNESRKLQFGRSDPLASMIGSSRDGDNGSGFYEAAVQDENDVNDIA